MTTRAPSEDGPPTFAERREAIARLDAIRLDRPGAALTSSDVAEWAEIDLRELAVLVKNNILRPATPTADSDGENAQEEPERKWSRNDLLEACVTAVLLEWQAPLSRIRHILNMLRREAKRGNDAYRGQWWLVAYKPQAPTAAQILVQEKDLAEYTGFPRGALVIPLHELLPKQSRKVDSKPAPDSAREDSAQQWRIAEAIKAFQFGIRDPGYTEEELAQVIRDEVDAMRTEEREAERATKRNQVAA